MAALSTNKILVDVKAIVLIVSFAERLIVKQERQTGGHWCIGDSYRPNRGSELVGGGNRRTFRPRVRTGRVPAPRELASCQLSQPTVIVALSLGRPDAYLELQSVKLTTSLDRVVCVEMILRPPVVSDCWLLISIRPV